MPCARDALQPEAITVLSELGIDISSHRSKAVADLDTSRLEAVITLCAEEVCALYPGKAHRLYLGLPDPAAVNDDQAERIEAFRRMRHELKRRIDVLFGVHDEEN